MFDDEISDVIGDMLDSQSRKARALAELWNACGEDERTSLRNVFWRTFQQYIDKQNRENK